MEAQSSLKTRRAAGPVGDAANVRTTALCAATSVLRPSFCSNDDAAEASDDGPFFDLEFSAPDDDSAAESDEDRDYGRRSIRSDASVSLSPSDDLFFKGRFLPLESPEPHSKPPFPSSLLKSATKLRVLIFRLKKPKSPSPSANQRQQSQLFLKFEEVPFVSLFTRDNSSRSAKSHADESAAPPPPPSEEKKFPKDLVQRYINKIKPLYVRVSKRYGDKARFSGPLNAGEPEKSNLPAGLSVVSRRLRKSRSASAAVAAVRSPPPRPLRMREEFVIQEEDGIQSAIAHCKRSLTSDTGSELPLVRSRSDPGGKRNREGKNAKI